MMETMAPTNGMVEVPVIDQPQTSNIAVSIAATQPNRSWRELFGDSSSRRFQTTLKEFSPMLVDGVLQVPDDVIQQGVSGLSDYLVGYFIEKRLPFHLVKANLSRQWKTKGSYEVTADDDLFYFKFSEGEDQTKILEAASYLGKPIYVDEATAKKERIYYARVCIVVVVDSKFPTSIPVKVRGGDVIDVKKSQQVWIPRSHLAKDNVGEVGESSMPGVKVQDTTEYVASEATIVREATTIDQQPSPVVQVVEAFVASALEHEQIVSPTPPVLVEDGEHIIYDIVIHELSNESVQFEVRKNAYHALTLGDTNEELEDGEVSERETEYFDDQLLEITPLVMKVSNVKANLLSAVQGNKSSKQVHSQPPKGDSNDSYKQG
ncbi:hypothetical protein IFM89_035917 [Coptis chinensis]|uniref:DUF4283 domain-containing protein n=1 Tax=Coptis chinensis TaxID=261450 RepID=A0A835H1I2_9MAGN|nr:hypothetical protein IFM89_035917 [Coptis chinensis]